MLNLELEDGNSPVDRSSSSLAEKMDHLASAPGHESLLQHLLFNLLKGKASMAQALPLLGAAYTPYKSSSSEVLQLPTVKRFRSLLLDAVTHAETVSNPDNSYVFDALHNVSHEITEFFAYAPYMKLPTGDAERALTLAILKELVKAIRNVLHYRKQLLAHDKRQRTGSDAQNQQERDSAQSKRSRHSSSETSRVEAPTEGFTMKPRYSVESSMDTPSTPELSDQREDALVMEMMMGEGEGDDSDDSDSDVGVPAKHDDGADSDSDVEADPRLSDAEFGIGQDPLFC
jgi:hypothetical protein